MRNLVTLRCPEVTLAVPVFAAGGLSSNIQWSGYYNLTKSLNSIDNYSNFDIYHAIKKTMSSYDAMQKIHVKVAKLYNTVLYVTV